MLSHGDAASKRRVRVRLLRPKFDYQTIVNSTGVLEGADEIAAY